MRLPSPTLLLLLPLLACFEKADDDDGDDSGSGGATDDGGGGGSGTSTPGTGGGGSSGGGGVDPGIDTGAPTPGLDLAGALTVFGGCSDLTMYASTAEGDWVLLLRDSSGVVEAAHGTGEPVTLRYDLSMDYDHSPSLVVQQGSGLRDLYCNDVVSEYSIDHTWVPKSGILELTIVPTGDAEPWGEYPSNATLELDKALFVSDDAGYDVFLGRFKMEAAVGWLPG